MHVLLMLEPHFADGLCPPESLSGQAVSRPAGDDHKPLDVAELLQLLCVSGSSSTPLGRLFV